MIVQACLNGARPPGFHTCLPITADAIAIDAAACVAAGAAELHLHPRGTDGQESLAPAVIDRTVWDLRKACPGTLFGVSTGAWIERDEETILAHIGGWSELPDYASVNLAEPAAPRVMERLRERGIGIEAGLGSRADADRLIALGLARHALRILIEIDEQDEAEAISVASEIIAVLGAAGVRRPLLLHGLDATAWHFVEHAREMRFSTRIGLEDCRLLPDGSTTPNNAALIAAAVELHSPFRPTA